MDFGVEILSCLRHRGLGHAIVSRTRRFIDGIVKSLGTFAELNSSDVSILRKDTSSSMIEVRLN